MQSIVRPLRLAAGAIRPCPRTSDSQFVKMRLQRPRLFRPCSAILPRASLPPRRPYSSTPDRPPLPSTSSSKPESSGESNRQPSESSSPPPDPEAELPSTTDSRRSPLTERFSSFMDNLQARYVAGLQTFNSITGYSAIEAITANNAQLEKSLATARARMSAARQHYKDVSAQQLATQREMATLLARKASWIQSDKNQFAELLDADYKLERDVAEASSAVEEAEGQEQNLISKWVAGMSRQYYEHQVYSDRIRRASTWGTWGLMGFNVLLFLMIQFVAEPWKRGRLLNSMEERERKILETVEGRLDGGFGEIRGELRGVLDAMRPKEEGELVSQESLEEPARTWKEFLQEPRLWKGSMLELYNGVMAEMKVKDIISITLQGALIFLLLRN